MGATNSRFARKHGRVTKFDPVVSASMRLREQISAIEERIDYPPRGSEIIEFSPRLAEHVLTHLADGNRPMKPAKIKRYAADLMAGLWGLTGDTVKFGTDGLLKDGQNRLAASVRAGRPLLTHVVFGIDAQLFARMDIGKNRNGADVFSIAGIKYPGHTSATVRWLLILTSNDPSNRGAQFSNEELLRAYRERFDAEQLYTSIQTALVLKRTAGHPAGPLAALHYLFSQRDQRRADAFFDEWTTGQAKRARAPSRYLQRRLTEIANSSNNRVHENVRNALIIKAWNAYVVGRSVTKSEMKHALSDPMPKIAG
jgi:hypothetical protein